MLLLDDDRADHEHVAAVLPDVATAEAAIAELRSHGLGSEQLGVAVRAGGRVAFEHDDDADLLRDVTRGAMIGAPVGALAGIGLVAVAAPWVAAGGLLVAAAGALGGLGGTFLGAFGGMLHGQPSRDEHLDLMVRIGPALAPGECSSSASPRMRATRSAGSSRTMEGGCSPTEADGSMPGWPFGPSGWRSDTTLSRRDVR